jgi:Cu2+-exporting ATPase
MSSEPLKCFHCNENIPAKLKINALINQQNVSFCCYGCKAVSEFINEQGCNEFYTYRGQAKPANKAEVVDEKWLKFDDKLNFNAATKQIKDDFFEISLRIEGLYCSACGWLIDKHLSKLNGIKQVSLNTITKQLLVKFNHQQINLSKILSSINKLGYTPVIAQNDNANEQGLIERKSLLKKIIIAGFGMMQVMTMSVPLYSDSYVIEPNIKRFFELISMLVATIVFFYSGKIFLKNAWRDISNKHLGMDVPVALSISIAYIASCWNVITNNNQTIYFDSMIMFVFFLLAGRYIEMSVRHQGMTSKSALSSMIPTSVTLVRDSLLSTIPLSALLKSDLVQVKTGEIIPCDGIIKQGSCRIDESFITGESKPVSKTITDKVMAGALVQSGLIQFESTAIGEETLLASLGEMLDKAQLQKPKTLKQIDKIAVWFVAVVLLIASITGAYYSIYQPEKAITIILAVLVATCPCALSLATPTALTAATVALMKKGVLVNNLDSLTKISRIKNWFFDKTGTLTQASMTVDKIHNNSQLSNQELLTIMASIEHKSVHPVASAFTDYYDVKRQASDFEECSGMGVQSIINRQIYKAGNYQWCINDLDSKPIESDRTIIYLTCSQKLLAIFELKNELRPKSKEVISQLLQKDHEITILSGDKEPAVRKIAQKLNIKNFFFEQSPQQKINEILSIQQQKKATIMVGDGVNDAPVLGQSDVSISFNQGTQIARSASDIILIGNSLNGLLDVLMISKKTNAIINENISWALVYNLSVTPLAIMGYLAPWMAAIGMSLSSLVVVLNARRLIKIVNH